MRACYNKRVPRPYERLSDHDVAQGVSAVGQGLSPPVPSSPSQLLGTQSPVPFQTHSGLGTDQSPGGLTVAWTTGTVYREVNEVRLIVAVPAIGQCSHQGDMNKYRIV